MMKCSLSKLTFGKKLLILTASIAFLREGGLSELRSEVRFLLISNKPTQADNSFIISNQNTQYDDPPLNSSGKQGISSLEDDYLFKCSRNGTELPIKHF